MVRKVPGDPLPRFPTKDEWGEPTVGVCVVGGWFKQPHLAESGANSQYQVRKLRTCGLVSSNFPSTNGRTHLQLEQ